MQIQALLRACALGLGLARELGRGTGTKVQG